MSGSKVLEGLQAAAGGNIARVHIEGQVWTRQDLMDNFIARERNRCARIADEMQPRHGDHLEMALRIAAAIRGESQ